MLSDKTLKFYSHQIRIKNIHSEEDGEGVFRTFHRKNTSDSSYLPKIRIKLDCKDPNEGTGGDIHN